MIIPIEIEDIEKIEKEKIKSIEYYSYTRGDEIEPTNFKAYLDINGKTLKRVEISPDEYLKACRGII
jgi:hypothetical protein